jgi:uncharacterized protein YjbI with pentapeptide repeats
MVKLRYSSLPPPKARAWYVRGKLALGSLLTRLGFENALPVSAKDRRLQPPLLQIAIERFCASTFAFATALLLGCGVITAAWGATTGQDVNDLWSEMGGMTLDVFFILIIYEAFIQRRARREAVERQYETIDDYKRWDAVEGRFRIAGALRRLGALGVTKVNFSGLLLSDFAFATHGIPSLRQSSFYDGDWGNPLNVSKVCLTRVSFDHVDCTEVQFSPFDPFEALHTQNDRYASLADCSFANSVLVGAAFNGAELLWTAPPPGSHFDHDEEDDGTPYSRRVSEGPFYEADLTGAKFRGCRFHHADFRDAKNLLAADFFRALGLETAVFDSSTDREWVIASSRGEPG